MKTTLLWVIFFTAGSTLIVASDDLINAAMDGNLKEIISLIESGVDINGKGGDGTNPAIFWAIDMGEYEAIKLLLTYCPDRNVRGNYVEKTSDGCFAVGVDSYSCSLLDAAYQFDKAIPLIEKYYREGCGRCLARDYTLLNTNWHLPITDNDKVVNVTCPAGDASRFSIWRCGNNSEWDRTPDLSQCRHHQFRQPNGAGLYLTANAIATVAADTENVDLWPGDLVYIIQMVKRLLKNYESDVGQATYSEGLLLSEKFLEGLVKTMGKVMEDPLNWQYISKEMLKSSATDIQESIVKAGLASARFFNASTPPEFSEDNIYVRVVRQPRSYFDLATNRLFQPSTLTETWIEVPELFYDNYTSNNGRKESVNETDDKIVVVFNVFSRLHCLMNDISCNPPDEKNISILAKQQVNSVVIGAKIGYGDTWNAEPNKPVVVNFSHIFDAFTVNLSNPKCVWWNTKSNNWSSEGCELQKYTEYYSICHCKHLTNLAIIMDFNGILRDMTDEFTRALEWLTIVGCSLSIGCLAVCIVLFCLLMFAKKKKNKEIGSRKYLIRLNLSVCLLLAQLILLLGLNKTEPKILCTVVAASLHFFFLATFIWSAIEAFTLYLAFVKVFDTSIQIKQKHYLIAGYGMPFFFVAATLAIFQAEGYGTDHVCWLAPGGIIWSFAGSIGCIMMANMVAFVLTIRHVWKAHSSEVPLRSSSQDRPNKRKILGSISIFLVLGLTWITGFFYIFKGTEPLAILFTVLNSIQGVGILFFGVIFQESTRTELFSIINEKVKNERVPAVVKKSVIKSLRKSGFVEAKNGLGPESLATNVTYRSGDNYGEASAKGAAVKVLCTDIESRTTNYDGALQKNFNDVTDDYDDYGEASGGGVASDSFSTEVRHRTLADTGDVNGEATENILNDTDYDEDSDITE